jgi:hypothetical protein
MDNVLFTSILRFATTIIIGKLNLVDVIAGINGLGQFIKIVKVISFIFNLISIVTDERACHSQIGCTSALSVREALQ